MGDWVRRRSWFRWRVVCWRVGEDGFGRWDVDLRWWRKISRCLSINALFLRGGLWLWLLFVAVRVEYLVKKSHIYESMELTWLRNEETDDLRNWKLE